MHPIDHAAAGSRIVIETIQELLIPVAVVLAITLQFWTVQQLLNPSLLVGLLPYFVHWLMRKPEKYIEQLVTYKRYRKDLLTVEE